jgi:ADP-ribosylglycohydrolase
MLAFAVGDALGWPIEMRGGRVGGTKDVRPQLVLDAWTRREGGSHAPHEERIPAGTYSDDTQMTLAVARSLHHGDWWEHLTRVELPWWAQYELGGGGATRRAAQAWAKGRPPWERGGATGYWIAGGNGAAMRVLPHCAAGDSRFDPVRERVLADGAATHGDPVALVGAQAYAYVLWGALRRRAPLAWGELLEQALAGAEDWAVLDPDAVPGSWSAHLPDDYDERWSRTVDGLVERLQYARDQMVHGALVVDDDVLRELGCFSRESGAGTVTTAGVLYLASRHAAEPIQGLLRAAFSRGADTDTLAAMTGAILGALHGPDWLGSAPENVMDHDLLRRTADDFGRTGELPEQSYDRSDRRAVEEQLAKTTTGSRGQLPFYGDVTVTDIHDLDNRLTAIRSWWIRNDQGQTFRIKRMSRAKRVPWMKQPTTQDTPPSVARADGRVRSGLVISVADVERARAFYEHVVGLPVSRQTKSAVVLAGWLALEVGSGRPPASLVASAGELPVAVAVTLYAEDDQFHGLRGRLEAAGWAFRCYDNESGPTLRTTDPDGTPVEVRLIRSRD